MIPKINSNFLKEDRKFPKIRNRVSQEGTSVGADSPWPITQHLEYSERVQDVGRRAGSGIWNPSVPRVLILETEARSIQRLSWLRTWRIVASPSISASSGFGRRGGTAQTITARRNTIGMAALLGIMMMVRRWSILDAPTKQLRIVFDLLKSKILLWSTKNSHVKTNLVHTLYGVKKYRQIKLKDFRHLLFTEDFKKCKQQA